MRNSAMALALCAVAFTLGTSTPANAQYWQCVGYARDVTGVAIRGNANTWWDQADGRYMRGTKPREGAVMAFKSNPAMPLGHVAVVSRIVSARELLIDHANWSRGGQVERGVRVVDVSDAGDWSAVKIWFGKTETMGVRVNPVAGFIYPDRAPQPDINQQVDRKALIGPDVIRLAMLEQTTRR